MKNLRAFGATLKQKRKAKNLSSRDLQLLCDVSFHTIAKIERGDGGDLKSVFAIMECLEIKIEIV